MDGKQYIDDKSGLILNHEYSYTYKNQRFEITLKDVFNRMVYEMDKSAKHFSLRKEDYKFKLCLKIIPQNLKKRENEGMKNKRNEKTDFGDTKCPYCEGQIWRIWKGEKIKCPWCGKEFITSSIIPLNCPDKLYHQKFLEIHNKAKK